MILREKISIKYKNYKKNYAGGAKTTTRKAISIKSNNYKNLRVVRVVPLYPYSFLFFLYKTQLFFPCVTRGTTRTTRKIPNCVHKINKLSLLTHYPQPLSFRKFLYFTIYKLGSQPSKTKHQEESMNY